MEHLIVFVVGLVLGIVFGAILLIVSFEVRERRHAKDARQFFGELGKVMVKAAAPEPLQGVILPGDKDKALCAMTERAGKLEVQLAGCGVAALGHTAFPAKKGDHGWSPAYQDVLDLRKKYDALLADAVASGLGKAVSK